MVSHTRVCSISNGGLPCCSTRIKSLRAAFALELPIDSLPKSTSSPVATSRASTSDRHIAPPALSNYPPAEPEALRLLAPQRGLIATDQSQKHRALQCRHPWLCT